MKEKKFDFNTFMADVNEKIHSQDYEQNIDLALAICMIDFYNYNNYCKANNVSVDRFGLCYNAFLTILLNRFNLMEINCDEYIQNCNSFLEELQSEENDYFDECVNITCEIMHLFAYISTKDDRNISAVVKLCFESAEFFLQRNECTEYDSHITNVAKCISELDVSTLTNIHESIRRFKNI